MADTCSELEDWFMTLAEARNDVIHKGVVTRDRFEAPLERPLSRYAGSLFWVGERVLREAIKGVLGADVLMCAAIVHRDAWREVGTAIFAEIQELRRQRGDALDGGAQSAPRDDAKPAAPPPRSLADLLLEMKCSAANQIELSKAHAVGSASDEVALANAAFVSDKWAAAAGPISLLISAEEKAILEAAGAEDEIDDYWLPCD